MVEVAHTIEKIARGVHVVKWIGLANGDTGVPFVAAEGATFLPDKTVHVKGTFGAGGTIVMQGGNDLDSPSYLTMTDIHGNAASYTAESLDVLSENPLAVRPSVSAGDETTDLDVIMSCYAVKPTR